MCLYMLKQYAVAGMSQTIGRTTNRVLPMSSKSIVLFKTVFNSNTILVRYTLNLGLFEPCQRAANAKFLIEDLKSGGKFSNCTQRSHTEMKTEAEDVEI